MDPTRNRFPESLRRIHLIAVCGTAMGALAVLLQKMGYAVSGSDRQAYPPMSRFLARNGIGIMDGFAEAHLDPAPDLVVVGNAVRRDNPEVVAADRLGLDYCSMPQAVNRFLARGKRALVVTGTHGKTTTASLLAWLLHSAGRDPSFLIGGILNNFDSNHRSGAGDMIVLEGDEYDSAFFDKRAKFFHYTPHIAILTSVEFDHADIYRDLDHVRATFDEFITRMRPDSTLMVCRDDIEAEGLSRGRNCRVETYGESASIDGWRVGPAVLRPPQTVFEVAVGGRRLGTLTGALMGRHNRLNALAAVAAAHRCGLSFDQIRQGLKTYRGVRRRQEVRGCCDGVTVIDDFAHHPTAVRETLTAVRAFFPTGRLRAVFEPRTNSSMRRVFQEVYPNCFDAADETYIRRPSLIDKVPANERLSARRLVDDLLHRGLRARLFDDTDRILNALAAEARPGDVVLVMSNGGFDNIHERLLKRLEKRAIAPG